MTIAIIGIACLFPGAQNPAEFWRNLLAGHDLTSPVTSADMGTDPQRFSHAEKGQPDSFYCMRGGYIRDFQFDPTGYRLPAEALQQLDPLFQWSLSVAREALRDSGYLPVPGTTSTAAARQCGVLLGSLLFPTRTTSRLLAPVYTAALEPHLQAQVQQPDLHLPPHWHPAQDDQEAATHTAHATGQAAENMLMPGYAAALVARALGLGGLHLALDAACATSLYAVRLACDYLQAGRADMMLAGAVSCPDPMFMHMGFSIFQAYPEEGQRSCPLDADSHGLLSGEGAGMVVLKRYADAVRDGDTIYATIRGCGLSNDGSGKHVLIPNPKGQHLAFERAYASSGVDPRTIDYVECHATGTPVGDITELNSLAAFFGRYGMAPRIGSVKSNLGHLLTAAGMASLIKVILSMQHGQVPATINLTTPLASHDNTITAAHIVAKAAPWPTGESGAAKRAGVSAFGFGGVNAHLILEHAPSPQAPDAAAEAPPPPPRLAITGMAAHFGQCSSLEQFAHALYDGQQQREVLPPGRWKGLEGVQSEPPPAAYIEAVDIDFRRFKMPPIANNQPIPQHLLLLKVADAALHDAGIATGSRVAVVVAVGAELALHQFRGRVDLVWQMEQSFAQAGIALDDAERSRLVALAQESLCAWPQVNQYTSFIGNVIASRVAALWDLTGPAFTVSAEGATVVKALDVARLLLSNGEAEAVLMGAVDLAGGIEHTLLQQRLAPAAAVGEGAGAVVLRRSDTAQQAGEHIHATIDALAIAHPEANSTAAHLQVCQQAHAEAGTTPHAAGYLEVTGTAVASANERTATFAALAEAYGGGQAALHCALGSVESNIGYSFAAAGMASLLKVVLALSRRSIPAAPGWPPPEALQVPALAQHSPFYVAGESRPWLLEAGNERRVAALHEVARDGTCAHLLLSEVAAQREHPASASDHSYLQQQPFYLLPIAAADAAALHAHLESLEHMLNSETTMPALAHRCFQAWQHATHEPYVLALTAHTRDELLREISRARTGIAAAFERGGEWSTPTGSYFTPQPLAQRGKLAFVYPGAFNAYIGLGQRLFQLFPTLYEHFACVTSDMERSIAGRLLYPRSLAPISAEELRMLEARMVDDSISMLEIGTSFATLYTMIMRDIFGVQPNVAFGYSQGETTMMHALGVWAGSDEASAALSNSTLYKTRLSGPRYAAREFWGMDSIDSMDRGSTPAAAQGDAGLWANYILMTSPERVQQHLADEPHVYLAIINTPAQVMISGDPAGCRRVIEKAKCRSLRAPFDHIIHSPPVQSEYDEFFKINAFGVRDVSGVQFYSAANYAPLAHPLTTESVAHSIAQVCCQQLDFPRLVEQVYADGARIFVELGPARNCSRWIEATLGKREHVALSINKKGADDHASLIRVLATLVSHRVPLNLAPLYPTDTAPEHDTTRSLVKAVPLGGERIAQALGTGEPVNRLAALAQAFTPQRVLLGGAAAVGVPDDAAAAPAAPAAPAEPIPHQQEIATMTAEQTPPHALPASTLADTFRQTTALATRVHTSFLQARRVSFQQLSDMVLHYVDVAARGEGLPPGAADDETLPLALHTAPPLPAHHPAPPAAPAAPAVWDEADLLEFAEGKIARVFGAEYALIDSYHRRVRLPTPPYLLVSRVTQISGTRGVFKPCTITTEYDIPHNAWYAVDGQIPWAVAVESGQCDLVLISYLGIDFECKGERVYRLLDCTLTFMDDLPKEGETLRYEISINSFARSGETLLFFFSYDCFVGDRLVLKMTNGCAGFFTDQELSGGRGVILKESEREARRKVQKRHITPPLTCARTTFGSDDLRLLSQGRVAACFGAHYEQHGRNPSLRLPPEQLVMADRIVSVEPQGGIWGLGVLVAEQDLTPEDWYFPCHFKDDEVLAGSLMAEGCGQLLQFSMLYLGLHAHTHDARFQPIPNLPQVVCCRGQALPTHRLLTYRLEIRDIGMEPVPYAVGNVDIILDGKTIVSFTDLGLQLIEKQQPAGGGGLLDAATVPAISEVPAPRRNTPEPLIDEQRIREFTQGSVVACFGEEYRRYEQEQRRLPRTPNGDLQLMSRVVAADAQRHDYTPGASLIGEYDVPHDAWYYQQNSSPTMPYAILMEIALQPCGFLSAYLGSCLLFPDADLYFRNLDGRGHLATLPDLRGKTISNQARLISSSSMQGVIIQKFSFAMACEGTTFYEGDAVFGYFTPEALANQVGLDSGKHTLPWYERHAHHHLPHITIDMHTPTAQQRLFTAPAGKPHYCLAPGSQLNFLDQVMIIEGGGEHGQGYIYASKRVNPADWFFTAHFYQDPVMPGSLGVEAILQAMQVYALHMDLGRALPSPHMAHLHQHEVGWKYRGQISREASICTLEVHIRSIEQREEQVVIIGDASMWRDGLRIYEVSRLAVRVVGEML